MDPIRPVSGSEVRCGKCATASAPNAVCAACGSYNRPGHEGRDHRTFIPMVDTIGGGHLCGLCALLAISEGGPFGITLLLDAPAVEVAR